MAFKLFVILYVLSYFGSFRNRAMIKGNNLNDLVSEIQLDQPIKSILVLSVIYLLIVLLVQVIFIILYQFFISSKYSMSNYCKSNCDFHSNKVFSFPYSLRFSLTIMRFSQTEHRDTYDCVNIYKQSIFEHPSFRNHTIQVHIVNLFASYFHQNLNSISRYPRK